MERYSYGILTRTLLFRNRKLIGLFTQRCNCCCQWFCTDNFSILCQNHFCIKGICIYKQILIDHRYFIFTYFCCDILVVEFHFLHLRRCLAVSAICNTITTEIIICRTLTEISAVCLELFSVTVFFINGLINIIPDKSTLIFRLCIRQICIFVHCTTGISHRMGILTADERFAVIFCEELLDCFYRRIHLTFHITGVIIAAIMEDTFIVNQSGRIFAAE